LKLVVALVLFFSSTSIRAQQTEAPSRWGMNYFSFFDGNSLSTGKMMTNELGGRWDDGLGVFNLISTTYKLNDRYSLDLQKRIEHIFMTYRGDTKGGQPTEPSWRFQGLRIGISGKLAGGDRWSIKGAFNTDVPELNGRDARFRKTILNPGLFAGLNYQLSDRWSIYSILSPRVFFYTDDEAVEPEWTASGRSAGEKPRMILAVSPSINYAINDKTGLRLSSDLSFRQFVESDPMYLKRWPTSMSFGPTFNVNRHFNIFPYVLAWPFDGKKLTYETASIGAWINGVVF
jgi:hypothetical protein